ncbi:MAG: tetratricopeptide repeat protein [Syntrophales bacterium]|nr:tetratricopeptide repeat protein [Syntrophales bacterium]
MQDNQVKEVQEHFNRGRMLSMKGLYPEAIDAYKKALEIDPGHTQARTNLKFVRYFSGIGIGEDRIRNTANINYYGKEVHDTLKKISGRR